MKKTLIGLAMLLSFSLLAGCAPKSGDELLAAPQPTKNYQALQIELQKVLDTGDAIYASPEFGENRNTVQLKDLDHDGEDEAIAFFRGREPTTSNQFTVIVYKKIADKYIKMGSVAGSGAAIHSVDYPTFTADGQCGIVIAWRLTTGESALGLTVCGFEGGKLFPMLETDYLSFALCDLTADGTRELITLNADATGKKQAHMYVYENGTMRSAGEAPLAADAKTIDRMTTGYIAAHQPAVFVEEKNESGIGLMTDILTYSPAEGFRNIAPESGENAAYSTYRPVAVYAADVNGDGITEIPRASLMAGFDGSSAETRYLLDWYVYGGAVPTPVCTTYNSQAEEWKLTVPSAWHDAVTVSRSNSSAGMSCTTFEAYNAAGKNVPLLSIYYLTGDLRTYLADNDNMYLLRETSTAIYAATIPAEAVGNAFALSMAQVEAQFSLIAQGWMK